MLLDVALTPSLLNGERSSVCVVVDVLRASSACVTMFDSGIDAIAIAPDPATARSWHDREMPQALLCGEIGGLPPEGFDYGNSPLEFSALDLRGRRAVLATSNGTRALRGVAGAPLVLVGCLLNRAAVAERAMEEAQKVSAGIEVICAGNDYGSSFSLDDAVAAGAIVQGIVRLLGGSSAPVLTDAARSALLLFTTYSGDMVRAFRDGTHGRGLEKLGFAADLEFCATLDRSQSVPALVRGHGELLMLEAR